MIVTYILSFMVNASGLPWEVKANVQGKVLKQNNYNYLVDFRDGLKKYPKTVSPESYDKVLMKKQDCVEE